MNPAHLHVERTGQGPGLLLSHGVGGSCRVWDALLPALARGHEVVAWDLRGHGLSDRPTDPSWYTRDAAVADLDALVRTFPSPPVLVGHSLGGYLSLAYLASRGGPASGAAGTGAHEPPARGLVLVGAGPGFRDPAAREGWNRAIDRMVTGLGMPVEVAGLAHMHDDLVMRAVPGIDLPVLLVVGSDDERFEGGMTYLAGRLPHAELVRIDGAGHDVHETHAAEVGVVVVDFLARLP